MAEGLDRHRAIHAIGSLLSEHIFDLIHNSEGGGGGRQSAVFCCARTPYRGELAPDQVTARQTERWHHRERASRRGRPVERECARLQSGWFSSRTTLVAAVQCHFNCWMIVREAHGGLR